MSREELGFTLLLSLPVGVGVGIATHIQSGGRAPGLAVLAGVVTAGAIGLVLIVSILYEPDISD